MGATPKRNAIDTGDGNEIVGMPSAKTAWEQRHLWQYDYFLRQLLRKMFQGGSYGGYDAEVWEEDEAKALAARAKKDLEPRGYEVYCIEHGRGGWLVKVRWVQEDEAKTNDKE